MKKLICYISILVCCWTYSWAAQEIFIYDNHNKRDPFWPLIGANGEVLDYSGPIVLDLTLEGIIAGTDGNNVAIINNEVVQKNAVIGAYKIEDIFADKVIVSKGAQTFQLMINKGE